MKRKFSKSDYQRAMLPRTRKAQFLDSFKMNYAILLKCGLMLLLFFLPLITFSVFMDIYEPALKEVAVEEKEQTMMIFHYIKNGGLILLSLVAIIGITGVVHVLRNFIWGEGIFFMSDFGSGIKQNAGKNVIFGTFFGLLYGIAYFIYSLFPDAFIPVFAILVFGLVFLPIYFWILLLNNFYSSKWTALLRNGLFFFVKTIGWSILGILMLLCLVALVFVGYIWLRYLILVLFIVFLLPIIMLIMVLYSTAKFDQYINKENYLDYYLKGLNHD